MIGFFRRSLNNKLAIAILALVLVAFIVTGAVTREMSGGGGLSGDAVARAGGRTLTAPDAAKRIQNVLESARQQNPQLDTATFVAQGGVEQVVEQTLSDMALEEWGRKQGIAASDRLVDGEIASIPAFNGPTGRFDEKIMRGLLAQKQMSERDLREDIEGGAIRRQILVPAAGGARVPDSLIIPYASLLLEQRQGLIGIVPVDAIPAGPPPSDAEVAAFYNANRTRYVIPERRALRYAMLGHEQAATPAAPTEAEIADFYKANGQAYAAKELRTLAQVILPDQAAASAFAAKVKGGASFDAAAQAAGFGPADTKVGEVSRQQYATKASDAVAAAAFAAPSGGLAGPAKGDLGWYVVKVEAVKGTPGKPLAQVHGEIVDALTRQKADEALTETVSKLEEALSNGSSFDEAAKAYKLTVVVTPPLLPDGSAPDDPGYQRVPELPLLLRAAQPMGSDDDPTVETIGTGQRYVLLSVAKVVPAAPAPLTSIRARVAADLVAKRRADGARRIAENVVAAVKGGKSLADALAAARQPPPRPAQARQIDLGQAKTVPPPLAMLFSMRQGDTKLLAAQQNAGWYVVQLAKVTPGDARTRPDLVQATRGDLAKLVGQEYAEQLSRAAQKAVGVKRDAGAIAKLKAGFAGNSGGQ